MPRLIITISLLFMLSNCLGQAADTLMAKKPHSPKKATIMSAILPGAGQVYNKKWWKLPIIYGGFGGLGYLVVFNTNEYQTYRNAYLLRLDDDATTVDQFDGIYTDANLVELKDSYRRNRDFALIGCVLLYAMNVIDANVDAHLFNFDVSEDLSMHIEPKAILLGSNKFPNAGIGISLRLK